MSYQLAFGWCTSVHLISYELSCDLPDLSHLVDSLLRACSQRDQSPCPANLCIRTSMLSPLLANYSKQIQIILPEFDSDSLYCLIWTLVQFKTRGHILCI